MHSLCARRHTLATQFALPNSYFTKDMGELIIKGSCDTFPSASDYKLPLTQNVINLLNQS